MRCFLAFNLGERTDYFVVTLLNSRLPEKQKISVCVVFFLILLNEFQRHKN